MTNLYPSKYLSKAFDKKACARCGKKHVSKRNRTFHYNRKAKICVNCINEIKADPNYKTEKEWLEAHSVFSVPNGKLIGFAQEPIRVVA